MKTKALNRVRRMKRQTWMSGVLPAGLLALGNVGATPMGTCTASAPTQSADLGAAHADACAPLVFSEYPPTNGTHYSIWALFKTYTQQVPAGFFLHSEEHGAVVFLYHCPGGCAADVAALQALIDAFPDDSLCALSGVKHRIILAPDTIMTSRFAAVAWRWSLKSDCLDTAAFHAFLTAHYAKSTENICSGGADFSSTGWCQTGGAVRPGNFEPTWAGNAAEKTLWEGSLANRARMNLEITDLDGVLLETIPLGEAGPGTARAIWRPEGFRLAHPATFTAVCRVKVRMPGGVERVLATKAVRLQP